MAAKKQAVDGDVTRIKASPSSKTKAKSTKSTVTRAEKKPVAKVQLASPIAAMLGYFTGAWSELKQVHWPTRRATWSLTLAVILFSAFFVVVVLLLDALFKYLFELVLA